MVATNTYVGVFDKNTGGTSLVRTTKVPIVSGGPSDHHPHHIAMPAAREHFVQGATSFTDTADHLLLAASTDLDFPFTYLKSLQVANKGGTSAVLTLKDGSGGSTIGYAYAQTVNGDTFVFDPPLKAPTSGNGIYIAADASSTTIYVSAQGFKANV